MQDRQLNFIGRYLLDRQRSKTEATATSRNRPDTKSGGYHYYLRLRSAKLSKKILIRQPVICQDSQNISKDFRTINFQKF